MHNNECNFYRLFTEHHVEGFKILKVYSLKHIDEDFSISPHILMDFCPNTASVHLKDTLNQGQLEAIAEQIALMHSYIIGNDVYIDEDLFKPFDYNNSFSEEEAEKFGFLLNTKVEECGDVLCHGDLWANNVLFDIDDDGKISKDIVAFIDFQLANVGNPAQDLTRILVINCDEDVRRANEQQIFEFYYEKLTFYLKKYNRKPPFSFEKLLLASKSQHVAQTIFSLFFIAFLFEAPEKQKYRPLFIRRARYIFEDCYNIAHKHFAHLLT
ncbi:unnamed protein product [Bursaphelenchus okinawaensis]|uniref:CHK kinase-like domain-containing protein n=1 Tax=Bursaphelenchus okinawaensis TaxID=465554 RepID=A0A811L4N0_9BILA|nr:unnamed protein product [Bursaphelenchus okinawaensis]CAG9116607.1 unnamed protein product [Bursaphelenchus okinawaensis]